MFNVSKSPNIESPYEDNSDDNKTYSITINPQPSPFFQWLLTPGIIQVVKQSIQHMEEM